MNNLYEIGQTVYWIKYVDQMPVLRELKINYIKQTKDEILYNEERHTLWVKERFCHPTPEDAVRNECGCLQDMLTQYYIKKGITE